MNNFSNPLTFNNRVSKLQNQQRKLRNYQNLKSPYNGTTWKNFAITRPRNISLQDMDRISSKTSGRGYQNSMYYQAQQHYDQMNSNSSVISQRRVREQNLRLSGVTYSNKRQQHATRVKQDALRRVKLLQQKVLPLLSPQKHHTYQDQTQQYGLAWQLKMQQRLIKVENLIEKVKNEVEIKYEKRLMEIERQWEDRITELLEYAAGGEDQRNLINGQPGQYDARIQGESYQEGEQVGNELNGHGYGQMNGHGYGQMNGRVYRVDVQDQDQLVNGHVRHA